MATVSFCGFMLAAASFLVMAQSTAGRYPSGAAQISAKGDELWLVDNMQSPFRWNGSQWEQMPGWMSNVGASPDGYTWGVGKAMDLYRWDKENRKWDLMPGKGYHINAISKDEAVVIGLDHAIYHWKNNNWTKVAHDSMSVTIGEQGTVWAVVKGHTVWHWDTPSLGEAGWARKAGIGVQIDAQSPQRVVLRNEAQDVFLLGTNGWQLVAKNASWATVGRSKIYVIETRVKILQDPASTKA